LAQQVRRFVRALDEESNTRVNQGAELIDLDRVAVMCGAGEPDIHARRIRISAPIIVAEPTWVGMERLATRKNPAALVGDAARARAAGPARRLRISDSIVVTALAYGGGRDWR
jgi:hypothetical protein